jgi:deoxyadenosine/deoxycytidine kinase
MSTTPINTETNTDTIHSNMNGNTIISIDGNIGSGKSTIVNLIKRTCSNMPRNIIILDEPVSIWDTIRDEEGTPILSNFYNDQHKYAFSFQILALSTRISILKKAIQENTNSIIITERNLQTDRYVFAQMLFDDGKISTIDFNIYKHMYETFIIDYPISKMIYINTNPSICFERINKRAREGETIGLEYLEQCDNYHNSLATHMKLNCIHVLEIDGNKNVDSEPKCVFNACTAIYAYVLKYDTQTLDHISSLLFQGINNNVSPTKISTDLTTLLNTDIDGILSMLTSIKSIEAIIRVFVNEIDSNIHDKCVTGLLKHGLGLFIKRLEEIKEINFEVLQLYAKKTVLCGNY